ncbi:spexin prohormone 1-like [Betta splendens]|uniref:Spexin prohormone 1-like n=1 Tax=Betta splendens TaxID=158456 RepID=A0A6P7MS33_BETSP|nr:spexin prohormone 1-like [Betta splendens]
MSTMSLTASLLVLTLLSQSWSAPQRISWTPQAILYLKGSQGHRSVLERTSREDAAASHSVSLNQGSDGRGRSLASSILLELLQLAVDEDEGNPDDDPDDQELYINYL